MQQVSGMLLLTVLLALVSVLQSQDLKVGEVSNPCINAKSCGECIRISKVCGWCTSEKYDKFASRCDVIDRLRMPGICSNAIVYPETSITVTKNENVQGGDGIRQPIQVQPQELNVTARTNEAINFKLTFRQAENYPVDLYFLLDLSYSMVAQEEAQKRLLALGRDMPASIVNITKDYRLGFGTFVDKTVMPFIAWTPEMQIARCPKPDKSCSTPHDFKIMQKLTDNGDEFAKSMENALNAISHSLDDPEGGMDGLMQALACEGQIGWRERSRRIIVYSSNSLFHIAGDGMLGGAIKNYDGLCHLDSTGSYSPLDKLYDYPSVSQIAARLRDKSTNLIFAVTSSPFPHYERLRHFIEGAEIGMLEARSENIINLIRDNYDKLRSKIQFASRMAGNVSFSFRSKCLGGVLMNTATCDGLEIKDSVVFDVSMTVKSDACEGRSGTVDRTVELAAVGLGEKLTINLKIICDCECERPNFEVPNSPDCTHGNGTLECGICTCNPGRYGRSCECDESQISSEESIKQCQTNENDTIVCSNHGECVCGTCDCSPLGPGKYSGRFCECNDYSCPHSSEDSSLCGGPERGVCICGTCQCLNETLWSGDACDCFTDKSACFTSDGLECNGAGTCECGRCICDPAKGYKGATCEDCPACPSQCAQYRDCAQCKAFRTGNLNAEDCNAKCSDVQVVDTLPEKSDFIRICDYLDTDECLFHFSYEYDQANQVVVKVQRTKDCPAEVNVAMIVGLVVAGVVLIPLLIICLIIFLRNRRDAAEFARFMKEKDKAKWESGANPIYKDPKSTFQNPTYKGGNK